ncbi:DUF4141 domain-containing protein [Paraburkholderia domus]|uniref:DUF4141 domain-containing protein n=1 Tax=Paraburkholderia domus TaxID=2793075 RepID=UPI0019133E9F|nr:DUF4141 domain-containing protein [Paraburkholderia domus]MBK5065783.1 DUF4141 domain-containing protein [Burkholderia sp. R-70199]CAE6963070.1 hypothetical protein R70199_07470 [Paraburkholderia domus]
MKFLNKRHAFGAFVALILSFAAQSTYAQWIVFDPTNFAQNVITAAKAVQGEIYQDTNIVYQYQMEANQLKQATGIDPSALLQQYNSITSDITSMQSYVTNLQSLYGQLQSGQGWINKVQGLVASQGKTPQQFITDQATLASQGNQQAINLFQSGNNIAQHQQLLMQRRQQLQDSIAMNPTQQSTAEATTHYLDIVTSQNNDLIQLQTQAAQQAAQKAGIDAQQKSQDARTLQQRLQAQQQELSNLGISTTN